MDDILAVYGKRLETLEKERLEREKKEAEEVVASYQAEKKSTIMLFIVVSQKSQKVVWQYSLLTALYLYPIR